MIYFDADLPLLSPGDFVRVEIREEKPTWIPSERRWSYLQALRRPWFCDVARNEDGSFRAGPWESLEAGHRYYYLITVFERRSLPEAQRTGSFMSAWSRDNPFNFPHQGGS